MAEPEAATESSAKFKKLPEPVHLEDTVTTQPIAETPDANQAWVQHNRFLVHGAGPEGAGDSDGD